jgi:large subunit ribosomal protein L30
MRLKLKRSLSGRSPVQVATAKALGLRKIGDTAEVSDHPATRGQVERIKFLLEIQ